MRDDLRTQLRTKQQSYLQFRKRTLTTKLRNTHPIGLQVHVQEEGSGIHGLVQCHRHASQTRIHGVLIAEASRYQLKAECDEPLPEEPARL
jgi:hypothetical protein